MVEEAQYENALALNSMLLEYRLESVRRGRLRHDLPRLGHQPREARRDQGISAERPGGARARRQHSAGQYESDFDYQWGLDRFIQEARTLARFGHPNIVRVNRFFEANGTSYMVMDYEAGESLHQYLKRVPMLDEAALKKIMLPILDGLEAVHQAGFLHRDIKPSNVFLRENGVPLLIDFGSARLATGAIPKNLRSIVSPGYAPLEHAVEAAPSVDRVGSDAEIPAAVKKEFMGADANGDGFLSPAEVQGRFPAVERNFQAVDANGDGRISLDELWQFRRKIFAGMPPG